MSRESPTIATKPPPVALWQRGRGLDAILYSARELCPLVRCAGVVKKCLRHRVHIPVQSLELRRQVTLVFREYLPDRIVEPRFNEIGCPTLLFIKRTTSFLHCRAEMA